MFNVVMEIEVVEGNNYAMIHGIPLTYRGHRVIYDAMRCVFFRDTFSLAPEKRTKKE